MILPKVIRAKIRVQLVTLRLSNRVADASLIFNKLHYSQIDAGI